MRSMRFVRRLCCLFSLLFLVGVSAVGSDLFYGGAGDWGTGVAAWGATAAGPYAQNWVNGSTAVLTNAPGDLSISLAESVEAAGIRIVGMLTGQDYTLTAVSPVTLTLTGSSPLVEAYRAASARATLVLGANVTLAGTGGLTLRGAAFSSPLVLNAATTHSLSGTVSIQSGMFRMDSGRLPDIAAMTITSVTGELYLSGQNVNRLPDDLVVTMSNLGIFTFLGQGGAANTETIGKIVINGCCILAANTGAGKLLLVNGLERAAGSKSTLALGNLNDPDNNVSMASGKPATDVVLPWVRNTSQAGFVQYSSSLDKFTGVTAAAPAGFQNLADWDTIGFNNTDNVVLTGYWLGGGTQNYSGALDANRQFETFDVEVPDSNGGAGTWDFGGFTLSTRAFTLRSYSADNLTLDNGKITSPDSDLYFWNVNNGTLYVNTQITGSVDPVLSTIGTSPNFNIGGAVANDYVGTMYINSCQVTLAKNTGLEAITGNVIVEDGGTLAHTAASKSNLINDSSVITLRGGASKFDFSATGTSAKTETVRAIEGDGTVVMVNFAKDNHTFTVDTAGGNYTLSGPMSGDGAVNSTLTKKGAGTWTLAGANTYNLNTFVDGGALRVNGSHVNGTAGRGYTVRSGATLGGSGRISLNGGTVAVQDGGTVAPGASVGTLTLSAALQMQTGAKLAYDLGPGGSADKMVFQNYAGGLTLNDTVIDFSAAGDVKGGTYTLMEFYSDGGTTLTDTGKPTSGLGLGAGLDGLNVSLDYSVFGKINMVVRRTEGSVLTVR